VALSSYQELMSDERTIAYWRSDRDGKPANGGDAMDAAAPGLHQVVNGPLELCSHRALHATLNPPDWQGDRLWLVALGGEVVADGKKLGALEREIICEVR